MRKHFFLILAILGFLLSMFFLKPLQVEAACTPDSPRFQWKSLNVCYNGERIPTGFVDYWGNCYKASWTINAQLANIPNDRNMIVPGTGYYAIKTYQLSPWQQIEIARFPVSIGIAPNNVVNISKTLTFNSCANIMLESGGDNVCGVGWSEYVKDMGPCPKPVGNITGRVFVDSVNGDLIRSVNESLVPVFNPSNSNYPQVFVDYAPKVANISVSNTSYCGLSGSYAISSLPAGTYSVKAWINQGPGWTFSEPAANVFAMDPGGICTFNSGVKKTGWCSSGSSGKCTSVTIPNVVVSSAKTTYLWFGVRKLQ